MSQDRADAGPGSPIAGIHQTTSSSRKRARRAVLRTVLGVCAALLLAEVMLRPWSLHLNQFNTRPVVEDSANAPVITVRSYDEGIATAHFTTSAARLTGIAERPGSPLVLIVGDSFVAAMQVNDRETMGARVEELSERDGHPVNVRQYGWVAASPAKYVIEAPQLQALWHPALTVVVMNMDDFVPEVLSDRWTTMQLADDGPALIQRVDPKVQSHLRAATARLSERSGLMQAVLPRFSSEIWPSIKDGLATHHASSEKETERSGGAPGLPLLMWSIARAHVAGLHRAFGDRLLIVYASEPGLDNIPDDFEAMLLKSCSAEGIHCVSTRKAFLDARDQGRFFAAGFPNSQPGYGHYNSDGHRLIADEIWRDYRAIFPEGK